jgi:hypothetical protein
METNEYIQSLGDEGVVKLIQEVQSIMQSAGNVTTGAMIDLLLDPLETSVVVKARVAILIQTVIKNMREMR